MKLKLVNTPNQELVYKNLVYYNKCDFDGCNNLLLFVETAESECSFSAQHNDNIQLGCISFNSIQRNFYNLKIGQFIDVKVNKKSEIGEIKSITLQININSSSKYKNNIFNIHYDKLDKELKHKFAGLYISGSQIFTLMYDNITYVVTITKQSNKGYITKDTNITYIAKDINVQIISSHTLNRELFQTDFDFETIGIGGLNDKLMDVFRKALITRAYKQELIDKLGIKHIKGVLLYGPPGTGKTLIARNIGKLLTPLPPQIINGPEILNKYVGESEKNIRELFLVAKKNPDNIHVIIFDEIDAICRKRGSSSSSTHVGDSVVNQLLTMIDGVNDKIDNVFIIAMTNRKDLLDPALIRAGRIEVHVKISLPDKYGRKQIFNIHTTKMRHNGMLDNSVDIDKLANQTTNYSGAEIESIVKLAASLALHECIQCVGNDSDQTEINPLITDKHFQQAISEVYSSIGGSFIGDISPNLILHTKQQNIYNEIFSVSKRHDINSVLIYGDHNSGKTTLVHKITSDTQVEYKKIINPIDVINLDEYGKAQYIIDAFNDARLCKSALVVLDDVEILINYANMDFNVSFSNKLYQTLLTCLKSTSPDSNNNESSDTKLNIIVVCNDEKLYNVLARNCNTNFIL